MKTFTYENKTLKVMNTEVEYSTDRMTVYLSNVEDDKVIDLITGVVAPWGDRRTMGGILKEIGAARGWW